MNDIELKRELRKKLLTLPHAKPAGKSIILFCPFCLRDTDHGHFYVTVDESSDFPILFHCFRCEMSGYLNGEVMRMLGANNLQLSSRLLNYNKHSNYTRKSSNGKKNEIALGIPLGKPERDEWKRKYICNRLGVDISYEELKELKAVFSLADLLKLNNIERLTVKPDVARCLDSDYLGFVSVKNEFSIFRDCTNKNKLRYNKYSIFQNIDNTTKFYTIPNEIDVLTTDEIHIILAEGVFDILGLFFNVFERRKKNMVYAAICGCGYTIVINYFIKLGFIGSNIHYHIFSDSDKKIQFYRKTIEDSHVKQWVKDIYIHYNVYNGEKDYGVRKDKIKLLNKKI